MAFLPGRAPPAPPASALPDQRHLPGKEQGAQMLPIDIWPCPPALSLPAPRECSPWPIQRPPPPASEGRADRGRAAGPLDQWPALALLPEASEGRAWPCPLPGVGVGDGELGLLFLGPAFAAGALVLGTRPRACLQIRLVPGHVLMERMWPRAEKINSPVSCLPSPPRTTGCWRRQGWAPSLPPPPPRPAGLCSQACFSEAEGRGGGWFVATG